MKASKEYNLLLESGELLELYPELSGVWEKDKKRFIYMWEQNQELFMDLDIDYDDF